MKNYNLSLELYASLQEFFSEEKITTKIRGEEFITNAQGCFCFRLLLLLLMKPLHPKISFHILHTPLYTIPSGTSKENLFNNRSLLGWQSFP